jgi:deazaflavin-dependent oxidoreductase (nitroreductase family)
LTLETILPRLQDYSVKIEKTTAHDAVRVFNKHVLNPAMLRLAGGRHFYASAVHHTGRKSGKHYVTPVAAIRVADGFLVPLPYGTQTDWLRNVEATAHSGLRFHGENFEVTAPMVIDTATAAAELPPRRLQVFKWFGVKKFVHLDAAHVTDLKNAGEADETA